MPFLFLFYLHLAKKTNPTRAIILVLPWTGSIRPIQDIYLLTADTTSGYYTLEILGANSSTSFNDYLGFYLDNFPAGGNITAGQYEDNSTSYTLLTTYANNGIDFEAGQSVAQDAVAYNVTIANHFKVNITAMDDKTAKGTFSGDYYEDGDVQSGTKLTITNGDFFVRFQ